MGDTGAVPSEKVSSLKSANFYDDQSVELTPLEKDLCKNENPERIQNPQNQNEGPSVFNGESQPKDFLSSQELNGLSGQAASRIQKASLEFQGKTHQQEPLPAETSEERPFSSGTPGFPISFSPSSQRGGRAKNNESQKTGQQF